MRGQGQITTAILCMVLAMLSICYGASLAKTIFPVAGAVTVTALRLSFAALVLCVVFRPWRRLPARGEWRGILFYGASLGTMNLLFYLSIERIPLGIALALEFSGPLAYALYRSRRRLDVLWVACAVVGIVLLSPFSKASAHLDPLGIMYVLVAGVFWVLYIIAGKRVGMQGHGGITVAWGMLVSALVVMPLALAVGPAHAIGSGVLAVGFVVGILSSAIPYSLEIVALKRLPAETFSILTSLEPAIGAVIGYIFLSEALSWTHGLAIALIVIASAGSAYFASRRMQMIEFGG